MKGKLLAAALFVCLGLRAGAMVDAAATERLMEAGHWKQARSRVEAAYKSFPNDAATLYLLSQVRWAFGDRKAAFELSERAIAIDPNKVAYHVDAAYMYGQILTEASTIGKVGLLRHFRRELDAALALEPANIDALLMRSVFLATAPRLLGGDMKAAEQIAQGLPKLDPVHGNLALGRFAYNLKDWHRAEWAYQQALASDKRSYAAEFALANLYCCIMDSPRWLSAVQHAREAIKLDGTRCEAHRVLAASLAAEQRWADLDAAVAEAERACPEDLSPEFAAAKILRTSGKDLPRAERYVRKYLTQEPEGDAPTLPAARAELALVLAKLGRRPEAAAAPAFRTTGGTELVAERRYLKRLE